MSTVRPPGPPGPPPGRPSARLPGRGLALFTAIAVALLAVLHGADLIQGLLGLPFTVNDFWLTIGLIDTSGHDAALGAPLNLAQTAVLVAVSFAALIGGLLCLGRRRGAARIGGLLTILAVVLPLTVPLGLPALNLVTGEGMYGSELPTNVLFIGFQSLVSATGLVPGVVAAILLVAARPRDTRPLGTAASAVGLVLAGIFLLEAIAALIRQTGAIANWWGLNWAGIAMMDPWPGLALCLLLLVVVMIAAGIGSAMLLGSASLLTRIGGGVVAAALAVRVGTQAVSWGLGYYLQIQAARTFDYSWIGGIEWTNAIAVPVLAGLGVLVAFIGLFTGPRRRSVAPATAPGGPPAAAGGPGSASEGSSVRGPHSGF